MRIYCPYCDRQAELVGGNKIYPHRPDLIFKLFYLCEPCNAYVGCHHGTTKPLGRLANAELRQAKIAAHEAFDPIWRSGSKTRSSAYSWLAQQMSISKNNCHIGMFDIDQCKAVVRICSKAT